MKRLKFYSALLAITLSLGAVSPTFIYAGEGTNALTNESTVNLDVPKARKADLDLLITTLESKHPNIYHQNEASVFAAKRAEIESKLEEMNDFEFAIAVSELVALVGDSHTKAGIGSVLNKEAHYLPLSLTSVKEGVWITAIPEKHKQVLGGILTGINGVSLEVVKEKLMPMMSFDNETYLDRQFLGTFYVYEILEHYGIVSGKEDIELEVLVNGKTETIKIDAVDNAAMKTMQIAYMEYPKFETMRDSSKIYFAKPLDDETLYIQYNACREDESLPMETFAEQVNQTLTEKSYSRVILDLRYNGGGSDGVLIPLMYVLEEKYKQDGVQLYSLIGSNTFSSALINAVELKEIGSIMVGTPTGGSVDHYGQVSSFQLPNSKINISYSNKFIDLSTLLKTAEAYDMESFMPDIVVEQTLEDYLLGKDTAVQAILADTKNKATIKTELTRSALAVSLGRDYLMRTNTTINDIQTNFEDIALISYVTPYVAWANTNQIMLGESETKFSPDKALTKAELAVVLMRYAKLLDVSLEDLSKDETEILDIKDVKSWQQEAVNALAGTSVMPLADGKFNPNEVVSRQGYEEMFEAFKVFITNNK